MPGPAARPPACLRVASWTLDLDDPEIGDQVLDLSVAERLAPGRHRWRTSDRLTSFADDVLFVLVGIGTDRQVGGARIVDLCRHAGPVGSFAVAQDAIRPE